MLKRLPVYNDDKMVAFPKWWQKCCLSNGAGVVDDHGHRVVGLSAVGQHNPLEVCLIGGGQVHRLHYYTEAGGGRFRDQALERRRRTALPNLLILDTQGLQKLQVMILKI